jgi:hypothetical protein
MDSPDSAPSRAAAPKVLNSALAGSIVILVIAALHQFAHVDLGVEVTGALTVVVSTLVGYLTPHDGFMEKGPL